MTCLIIDDEPHAIEVLERYVKNTALLELKGSFRNPLKALEYLQAQPVDLLFLDVNMPHLSGLQFLSALRSRPLVIFTTAYSAYAAESYEWDAVDYLVKPIVFERFLRAVHKAHGTQTVAPTRRKEPEEVYVLLKSGPQTHRVKLTDILYVSKESNYLEVHTTGGVGDQKILLRANMNDIFSWLPGHLFCRVHKSYVVALQHVTSMEAHQLRLGKATVPLGSSYRDEFVKRMQETGG